MVGGVCYLRLRCCAGGSGRSDGSERGRVFNGQLVDRSGRTDYGLRAATVPAGQQPDTHHVHTE